MLAGRIGGLRCGGPLFDWQWLRVEMPGMPEGQGDGRRRKRAKPTSGATRHLLPEEGGKSGEKPSPPFPRKGDARRAGGWAKAKERKANLRRCAPPPSRGRREKRSKPSTPFPWKGDARRAGGWPKTKRAKPTSGATRHLLPEEGGRNGMSNPATPFPWKGDARRAGGWAKTKVHLSTKIGHETKKIRHKN